MRYVAVPILTNGDMSSDLESIGIDLNQIVACSIQAVFTGSPVGILKLQVSNEILPPAASNSNPISSNPAANVVNWTDVTASMVAVASDGNFVWDLPQMGFKWIRLVYTHTSGSGSLSASFSAKGV